MRIGTVLLLALPLVSLAELWAHRHFRSVAPTSEDWQRLEPEVIQLYRPNDLVTVTPHWADPLLRQLLGDRLMPIEVLARADDETLERVIVVSFGAAKDEQFAHWRERDHRASGPFQISLRENPQLETARMRLLDRVHPGMLQVFEGSAGDPHACSYTTIGRVSTGGLGGDPTLPANRFACPSGEPHLVAITTIDDQAFLPRRCIWAHPSALGPLTLVFRDVWLGQKLVGHAGLPWLLSRDGAGTPIRLSARFEGTPVGNVVIEDTQGWTRFEWSTLTHRDQRGDLELVVSSEQAQNRRFCFTLESR
jgi:hypothetical protein